MIILFNNIKTYHRQLARSSFKSVLATCMTICYISAWCQGQEEFNVANQLTYIDMLPPSPGVASLSTFAQVGTGLNSGTVQFNVPLTSVGLNGVTVPIALNYSSTGIKIDEISSHVGMGWRLSAGGSISRVMQGAVDENSTMIPVPANKQGLDFYNYMELASIIEPGSSYDTQPDLFSFDVCGLSGKFYLDDNNNPVLFPKSNLKITTHFTGTEYNFIITDTQGNRFYLGGVGYTETSKRIGGGSKPFLTTYPTAWFLRKIEPYDGGEITFHYKNAIFLYGAGVNQTLYYTYPNQQDACERSCPIYSPDITISHVNTWTHYLDSIHAPDRILKLEYRSRQDVAADVLLKTITVFENNASKTVKEVFDFTIDEVFTNLYPNTTTNQHTRYRPFLREITKSAEGTSLVLNSFEYNDPEGLPVRLSFAQDHWGYFNGRPNTNFVPKPEIYSSNPNNNPRARFPLATANREVNQEAAMKGMLNKITYPTKGYDIIEYESNTYDANWTVEPTQDTTLAFSRVNTSGNVYNQPFNITLHFTQTLTLEIDVQDLQLSQSGPIKAGSISLYNEANILVGLAQVIVWDLHDPNAGDDNQPHVTIDLPAGNYHGTFHCIGKVNAEGSVTYIPDPLIIMEGNMPVGGLRVKSIKGYSDDGTLIEEKHYEYASAAALGKSSLVYYRPPHYSKFQVSTHGCMIFEVLGDQCFELICSVDIMYSSSVVNLNPFSGNHVSYSHVIEYNGPTKDNGFIEHEYYVDIDSEGFPFYGEPIIGAPRSNNSILYQNREKQTKVYKKVGAGFQVLKRTLYQFSWDSLLNKIDGFVVNKRGMNCYGYPSDPPTSWFFDRFEATHYKLFSPWTVLKSVTEENFAEGNPALVSTITYEYKNTLSKLPTMITTTGSDEKTIVTKNMFANDTLSIPELTEEQRTLLRTMRNENIVTPLVYQEKFVDGNKISAYRSFYMDTLAKVHPSKVAQYAADGTEIESFEFMTYDYYGNIMQQRKNDGSIYSYLWDNNNQFVSAEVIGAAQNQIAATSFEADGTGNWSVTGTCSAITDVTSPTGKKYGKFTSGGSLQKTGLSSTTPYTVSFWHKSGTTVTVPGSTDATTVPGKDGWFNTKVRITNVTSVTINIPSNGEVDDIRLHPEQASMRTFTSEPVIGTTSVSDANNRVTYYEYDSFGRLKSLKDHNGNLLKLYNYHYKD